MSCKFMYLRDSTCRFRARYSVAIPKRGTALASCTTNNLNPSPHPYTLAPITAKQIPNFLYRPPVHPHHIHTFPNIPTHTHTLSLSLSPTAGYRANTFRHLLLDCKPEKVCLARSILDVPPAPNLHNSTSIPQYSVFFPA